jgi:DNA anti-recombination protein RmuC
VVRRLSTVLAGGTSKGRAGENVLREHLAELPPGMLVTDFRVNGRVVEFGLLLPDGRRLPVDSKWSALAEPSSPLRTLGTLLVVAGVVLVSSTGEGRASP